MTLDDATAEATEPTRSSGPTAPRGPRPGSGAAARALAGLFALLATPAGLLLVTWGSIPWRRAIATDDLLRLTRRLLVEGGVGQFADALVAAAPPGTEKVALSGEQAFQVFKVPFRGVAARLRVFPLGSTARVS